MPNVVSISTQLAQETITWKNLVLSSGGDFEWNSVAIANNFVKRLKSQSYYNKIKYLMPFLGKGFSASIVPLVDQLGAGSPTNTNFTNSDFNQRTGLQGNNSNKVLTFPFFLSQLGDSGNGGIGFWELNFSSTNNTQYAIGTSAISAADPIYALRFGGPIAEPVCEFVWGSYSRRATLSEARSNSHYYGNRSSLTSRVLYKNGVSVATNAVSDSTSQMSTLVPASFALNQVNTFTVYWGGSKGVEYYTDGTLTSQEASSLHSLISVYLMSPAGRI